MEKNLFFSLYVQKENVGRETKTVKSSKFAKKKNESARMIRHSR